MNTRTCKVCGKTKAFERSTWKWNLTQGCYGYVCKACHNLKSKASTDPIAHSIASMKCHTANPESVKKASDKYEAKNRQRRAAASRAWYIANLGKAASNALRRQLSKIQRTPAWVDVDERFLIDECYSLAKLRSKVTGIQWHVDHIVPLRGAKVSGLHVINNLQVIPAAVNLAKHNKYTV